MKSKVYARFGVKSDDRYRRGISVRLANFVVLVGYNLVDWNGRILLKKLFDAQHGPLAVSRIKEHEVT